MKKSLKWTYLITTGIIIVMMAYSTFVYLTNEDIKLVFAHLGYPDYFRVQLAIAKLIGVIILIVPVHRTLKYLAYAGFAITFLSANIAHTVVGDSIEIVLLPLLFLFILIVSFLSFYKMKAIPQTIKY